MMLSLLILEKTLKKMLKTFCRMFFNILIHHRELLLQLYQDSNFSQKNAFCKKPIPKHTSQFLDLFVTYRGGSFMNNGYKNLIVADDNWSFSQQSTSSLLVIDSFKNKIGFPPLNDSNIIGTVDFDSHVVTKLN